MRRHQRIMKCSVSGEAMARETETSRILGEALASSRSAVVVTSPARVITAANPSAYALLGYAPSHLVGQQVRALYAAGDDYAAAIHGDASLVSGAALPVTLRDQSGALIDADAVMLPVRNAAGDIATIIEIWTPAPREATAAAAKPMADRGDMLRFARGAAHDFKNLLTIVAGNLGLARDARSTGQRLRFFDDAERAVRDAVRIADQMISFARNQHVAPEDIDVAHMIATLVPTWSHSVASGVSLTCQVNASLPQVLADRSGLENALLNLVINARDATADSGEIEISAAVTEADFGSGEAKRPYVAIAVRDTGIGMTNHVCARAFDPFFSTKPASHGRGLGLATVSGFARQADGHVAIDSTLGVGTTVTIYLPPSAT